MNNPSNLLLHSLREVPPRYKTLFGLEIAYSEVVDVAELVIEEIGNIALGGFSFTGKVCNHYLCLPCELHTIHSVTGQVPYNNMSLNSDIIPNGPNQPIMITSDPAVPYTNVFDEYGNYVGRIDALNLTSVTGGYVYNKHVMGPPKGNYIGYQRAGNNKIKINAKEANIEVIFETVIADEEGMPLVESKTVTAIAHYLFKGVVNRGYFKKIYDANQVTKADKDYSSWVGKARVGQIFSDNQQNDIMQAAVTHNRKMYGLPYRST
jgi:hypothetical protein